MRATDTNAVRVAALQPRWKCLALMGAWLVLVQPCQAQTMPEPRNQVQLSASGSVEAQQDWLTLTLSTSKEGSDAAAVQSYLRQATETALTEIKKSLNGSALGTGIEVHTAAFSLRPQYANDGRMTGWSGSTELVLEGTDFGRISSLAARAAPLTISNLTFSLSRTARANLEDKARKLAIESFRSKAMDIAKEFGFQSYALREVAVNAMDQSPGPRPQMMAMAARAKLADSEPLAMESGKSLVVVTVSGAVQLQ